MNKFIYLFFGAALILITVLQIHNVLTHPYTKGFDNQGHLDYINLIKKEHRVPLANEGWGMFQPPLYYIFASFFDNPKSVQFLNLAYWLILLFVCNIFLQKTFKDPFIRLLGVILTASVPVVVYLTPLVSNEFFTGVIITSALVYYCLNFQSGNVPTVKKIIMGILIGLAMLAKATGTIFLFAVLIDQFVRCKWKAGMILKQIWVILLFAGVIGGWFYVRNTFYFGNPFIINTDFLPVQFENLPGYRDLKFFTDLSGFFTFDLFGAHWYSLWAGTYFSFFFDGHNAIVPIQPFSKAGNILVFLTYPFFILSVIGFIKKLRQFTQVSIFYIYSALLFMGYLTFTLKIPTYASVRSTYLVSLVLPWSYFALVGYQTIRSKIRRSYTLVYIALYLSILLRNFWIR